MRTERNISAMLNNPCVVCIITTVISCSVGISARLRNNQRLGQYDGSNSERAAGRV